VIAPHPDVQAGRYHQAEFAADLAQVLAGNADAEYQDAKEFFRRTYVTQDMRHLLRNGLERLAGKGGEPVVDLKTAFGGGKTHTLLALYHLVVAGDQLKDTPDITGLLDDAGLDSLPAARVAALVGTALNPARPSREVDDLMVSVNTLWGEMAYQLGGLGAFKMVLENDANASAPGSNDLTKLFQQVGPCVILIDEMVAFLRNIRGIRNLPAGDYNKNISFLQNLTEAVKRSPTALLVVSIPESKMEYGDASGEEMARQVEHIIGRLSRPWQPVGALESFEVVRRRLFQEIADSGAREETCEAFGRVYRNNASDFPTECREAAYVQRMKGSYPIHPEVFDRLYEDWSTLERFQRTRGVLRLMASTIHELWSIGDESPLIMPGSMPMYSSRVRDELTRYLGDQWNAVIDSDVDGEDSEPKRIDQENQRFGQLQAARRISRTIFLGSTPKADATARGIDDVRVKLGAVQAGETISVYGDALNRLQQRLSHLYTSGQGRYWYAVQPNLNRVVADRSSRVTSDDAFIELERRLKESRERGQFAGVHVCPNDSADVPDEAEVRLVVLSPRDSLTRPNAGKKDGALTGKAVDQAQGVLDQRGGVPRHYRNMLVFAAPDQEAMSSLLPEVSRHLAWKSIVADSPALNLDKVAERQAKEMAEQTDKTIVAQLDEAYKWALVPEQEGTESLRWEALTLGGGLGSVGSVVQRASHKLQTDELLITSWSPIHLRTELDRYLWKDGQPHILVKQLWDYFATYCYLPRLKDRDVLVNTIRTGVMSEDFFGYATNVTEDGKYEGLAFGQTAPSVYFDDTSVVVRKEIAEAQKRQSVPVPKPERPKPEPPLTRPKRFHGTVRLDALKLGSSAGRIGDEVIQHLQALMDANVDVTLEISALIKDGVPEDVVRTILENAKVLKFENFGFEDE
jgi:predicted AAA+ superfamily ATPase